MLSCMYVILVCLCIVSWHLCLSVNVCIIETTRNVTVLTTAVRMLIERTIISRNSNAFTLINNPPALAIVIVLLDITKHWQCSNN